MRDPACTAGIFPAIFAQPKRINDPPNGENGCVAQLDRASDYESEGLRFDSLHDHEKTPQQPAEGFFYAVFFRVPRAIQFLGPAAAGPEAVLYQQLKRPCFQI
jgi:hypothetical protein